MGLSARVTRVVGQIGDCRCVRSARRASARRVDAGALDRTLPFVRHRQVGASLCGLIADSDPQSRAGRSLRFAGVAVLR